MHCSDIRLMFNPSICGLIITRFMHLFADVLSLVRGVTRLYEQLFKDHSEKFPHNTAIFFIVDLFFADDACLLCNRSTSFQFKFHILVHQDVGYCQHPKHLQLSVQTFFPAHVCKCVMQFIPLGGVFSICLRYGFQLLMWGSL